MQLLDALFRDGVAVSIITFGEVYDGICYGSEPKHNEAVFRRFLRGIRVLGLNHPIARRLAIVRGALRGAGQLIPQPDLLIAATALHHDLSFVTRNLSDSQRVPGLRRYQAS